MGLFGLSKPKKDAQTAWLDKVNEAYQRAFQVKNAAGLEDYLTRPCMSKLLEKIRMGEKAYAGLVRYQHVSWVKGECTAESVQYIKKVTYDQIKMSHGIIVPVGDETNESWTIVKINGAYKVSEIRRID